MTDNLKLQEAIDLVHEYGVIKAFAGGEENQPLIDAFQLLISAAQSIIVGEECLNCKGKGGWYEHTAFIACEGCNGTGQLPKPSGEAKQMTIESIIEIIEKTEFYRMANYVDRPNGVRSLATALYEAVYGGRKE